MADDTTAAASTATAPGSVPAGSIDDLSSMLSTAIKDHAQTFSIALMIDGAYVTASVQRQPGT